LALGLDPSWRHRPADQRRAEIQGLLDAEAALAAAGCGALTYSSIGLEPGIDLLVWRSAAEVDLLEAAAARWLRSGVGAWLEVRQAFLARTGTSQYVARPSPQELALLEGERSRYLIAYPFVKSTEWYLLSREARQGVMNEHMRVGRGFPMVRQLLGYSFGLDDQDFLVVYETDDLSAFGELVHALRATEARRSTVRDTPILLGRLRPLEEILHLLGD
jgi:chlorite dismutase